MKLETISPIKALNKAYYKQSISRNDIDLFKTQLKRLFDRINEKESEEHLKNIVSDFLKETYYKQKYEVNTKGRNDLVIYNGITSDSPVAVIIETKRPGSPEMISKDKPNNKALHELMLYYIVERFEHNNKELKYLIATDIYNWYIFDAILFERFFAKNQNFVDSYKKWKSGMLVDNTTEWFYKEIAKEHLYNNIDDITCTYFNLKLYENKLDKTKTEDDEKLTDLYKILAPVHLLKQPFVNDSNNLNKEFYNELLHILGLEEDKTGGKRLIQRKENGNEGSLLENTINILEIRGRVNKIKDTEKYGTTQEEKIYNIALELCITWLNRILFLKLLEGQLIKYNGNKDFAFLNSKKIKDYDALNELFFEVLARQIKDRRKSVKEIYYNIPYLNSSLFESTDLEDETIQISDLKDRLDLPLYSNTVIKDEKGKKITGCKLTLHYLFEFLEAYDFATDSSKKIQEQNKTIINASVLGLIYEKINGYKDGSYFTPGYITMYMCSEIIRRSVVQKFNEKYNWNCVNLDDLYNKIENLKEANDIINNLKLCDPAVGSGHFLVSALNEIIAIKSDLGILCDRNGRKIKDWKAIVSNDELLIYNVETDDIFEYQTPKSERVTNKQVLQETLFHEKQTIIENCLFGVDINPNSVKICRLRLWIELLKNAYYTKDSNYTELETLPNIDINIKEGNSLLSRFDLQKTTFTKFNRTLFETYKINVNLYKNEKFRNKRAEIKLNIENIKNQFKSIYEDPFITEREKINKEAEKLYKLNTNDLFGITNKDEKHKQDIEDLEKNIVKLKSELQNKIIEYEQIFFNAFEWRFEFPEVLDADGKYIGFDMVIGNPPYIRQEKLQNKFYYQSLFPNVGNGLADIYVYFFGLGLNLINNSGYIGYITLNKWMKTKYGLNLRNELKNWHVIRIIDFFELPVFEEAATDSAITFIQKKPYIDDTLYLPIKTLQGIEIILQHTDNQSCLITQKDDTEWKFIDANHVRIIDKIYYNTISLKHLVNDKIFRGITTGLNEAFVIDDKTKKDLLQKDNKSKDIIKKYITPTDINKWQTKWGGKWLIFTRRGININNYKSIEAYLSKYRKLLEPKPEGYSGKWEGRKPGPYQWYEIQDSISYYKQFEEPKIIYIHTAKNHQFYLDYEGTFINNSCYMIISDDKFLYAYLNSKLFHWFKKIKFVAYGDADEAGRAKLDYNKMITIPMKNLNEDEKRPFIEIIDKILELKRKDSNTDVTQLEHKIDNMIYELYGLTEEEIKIVEGE